VLSVFKSSFLKSNLVGTFTGFSSKKFIFVDQMYLRDKSPNVTNKLLSFFYIYLKPLGKFEPNLVGMFIVWTSRIFTLFLLKGSTQKKQRGPKVSKRVLSVLIIFPETTKNVHWIVL
jgi:hypothetical protein